MHSPADNALPVAQSDRTQESLPNAPRHQESFAEDRDQATPAVQPYTKEWYRSLLEAMSDTVVVLDRDCRYLYVNDATARSLHMSTSALLGKRVQEVFPDFEDSPLYVAIQHVMESGVSTSITHELKHDPQMPGRQYQDRIYRWSEGVVCLGPDVTEFTLAKAALEESENRFRSVFEQSMDALCTYAYDGSSLQPNQAWLDLFGHSREDLSSLHISDVYADSAEWEHTYRHITRDGFVRDEVRKKRKDGTIFDCERRAVGMKDASGTVFAFLSIVRDITERKRTETALRESELRYRSLFESSADMVLLLDLDGRIVDANPSATELLGYPREHLVGLPAAGFLRDEARPMIRDLFASAVWTEHRPAPVEVHPRRRDDSELDIELYISLIRLQGSLVGIEVVGHDITARNRQIREREQASKRLTKALTDTIAAMSAAVAMRDPYTAGHQSRVKRIACAIAQELGMPDDCVLALELAADVHDLGKLLVPAEILTKPSRLTDTEFRLIKEHPQGSYDLLKGIDFQWPVAQIAYQHHERIDGSGYPQELKGEDMLPEARILAVADVFEAMASHRPYRPALGIDAALNELEHGRDIVYDSRAVDALIHLVRDTGFALD